MSGDACKKALAAAAWTLAALAASASAAREPLSTREMQALSASDANRAVRQDLLSILQPHGRIRIYGVPLSDVSLETRPFQTEYPGLCEEDALDLKYAPRTPQNPSADQPIRPYGFDVTAYYKAGSTPVSPIKDGPVVRWSAACDRLGKDHLGWFRAPTAFDAARGVNVLHAALARLKAGSLKFPSCSDINTQNATCEAAILARVDETDIWSIDSCDGGKPACYVIDFLSEKLTITYSAAPDSIDPNTIETIAVEGPSVIVLPHELQLNGPVSR
jgi:hypothetical protein